MIKSEQIQPLFGTVKVSGDCDTDVVFTDMETGEKYVVGYITSGVSEKIKLEKGKWYTVAGGGNLVISPVNVRVEKKTIASGFPNRETAPGVTCSVAPGVETPACRPAGSAQNRKL